MNLNLGYVSSVGVLELGYTGPYTAYPYVLTSHGPADPNSIMAEANFASTDPVDLRIISDFDPAKVTFDWQAFSDGQLWRQDVNTLAAVTVNSTVDTTDTATIGWRTSGGATGQFTTTISIDGTAPSITSVSVPAAATYAIGDVLTFTPNWNEVVNVTGVPAINLDVGGSARQANYSSGTGTSATAFTYTVQSGDLDTDGVTVTSLTLDGGTIKDSAGNDATLTLNAVGDTSGVLVDSNVTGTDTAPNDFSLGSKINQTPGTLVESSPITVEGISTGASLDVTVTGGEYAKDTGTGFGAFTTVAGTAVLGDRIKVRHTTSASNDTGTITTLNVGAKSSDFTTITEAAVGAGIDRSIIARSIRSEKAARSATVARSIASKI